MFGKFIAYDSSNLENKENLYELSRLFVKEDLVEISNVEEHYLQVYFSSSSKSYVLTSSHIGTHDIVLNLNNIVKILIKYGNSA